MTPIEEFVSELAGLDIKLWAEGETLRCSAPDEVLTDALKSRLAERKSELLAFLEIADPPGGSDRLELAPVPRDREIPLSYGQERIWSLAKMRPQSSVYNVSTAFRLKGSLNVRSFRRAMAEIRRRHEILRTTLPAVGRNSRQRISPADDYYLPIPDVVENLRDLPKGEREQEIQRLLRSEYQRPFDLETGPLWRAQLLKIGKKEHIFSFTIHHIIFDSRSRAVLLHELALFYEAFSAGKIHEISELPIQYADFACWQCKRLEDENAERQLSYWGKQFEGGVSQLRIPADHSRAAASANRGENKTFELPHALSKALFSFSRGEKASMFITLLAAFYALLHRYTGQEDLVVCSPLAARDRAELEGLIGYFNNIVVLRADLSANPSFRELIARVRRIALDANDNQNLPLQRIAELPSLAQVPLSQCMFSYQDMLSRNLNLRRVRAAYIDLRKEESDFELAMYMECAEEGDLSGTIEYNTDRFHGETISRLLENFETVLASVVANPDQPLALLPKFGEEPAEIEALLASHPQIDEASVVDLEDRSGSVAYLVLNEDDVPNLDDIRGFAREQLPDYLVPLAFVPLDVLPLTMDGAIDHGALPPPLIVRGRPDTHYAAPRTALERQLAGIWRKVFWLDQEVGIHDHFADLGGYSLLSVQLVLELEKELRRTLPREALFELGTIAEMARIIEQQGESRPAAQPFGPEGAGSGPLSLKLSPDIYHGQLTYTASWAGTRLTPDSLMVGLNMDGAKQTLFWCLQRHGELTQMAKHIGPDQPIFGMRSGNKVMKKNQENINALAAHYVSEILAAQPQGPYLIGGHCQAAQIAFQIAKQLTELGHEISLLILMEQFIPQDYAGKVAMLIGADSDRRADLFFHQPEFGWNKYYSGERTVDIIPGRHHHFFREPNIQVLCDTVRQKIEAPGKDPVAQFPIAEKNEFQRLPETAYRSKITAKESWAGAPSEDIKVLVEVSNESTEAWRPSGESGVFLANRWLNVKGDVVTWLDGRTALSEELGPGSSVELELTVRTPNKSGQWTLELDMVDEGVAWFADKGSVPTHVKVNLTRGLGIWARLSGERDKLVSKILGRVA